MRAYVFYNRFELTSEPIPSYFLRIETLANKLSHMARQIKVFLPKGPPTLKTMILAFPWSREFSKAEWSFWAKESGLFLLCCRNTRIFWLCKTKTTKGCLKASQCLSGPGPGQEVVWGDSWRGQCSQVPCLSAKYNFLELSVQWSGWSGNGGSNCSSDPTFHTRWGSGWR